MAKRLTKKRLLSIVDEFTPDNWTRMKTHAVDTDGTVRQCVWGRAMSQILELPDWVVRNNMDIPSVHRLFENSGYSVSGRLIGDLMDLNDATSDVEKFKEAATIYLRDGDRTKARMKVGICN